MRHKLAGRKLNRTSSHRKAMFASMATALLEHGQIRTTLPKAKDLRRVVEPLITKAKKGDVAARREVARTIKDETVLRKLFDEVAPGFKERAGGYTRVLKAGFRQGDSAPMALIELTEAGGSSASKTKKSSTGAKKAKTATTASKAESKSEAKSESDTASTKEASKKDASTKAETSAKASAPASTDKKEAKAKPEAKKDDAKDA